MTERSTFKNMPLLIIFAYLFLLLFTAIPVHAGNGASRLAKWGGGKRGGVANPENMEQWRKMTPERKKKIIERYQKWEKLPPEKREKILRRYRKFRELPPEKKRKIKKRWKRLKKLPPGERESVRSFMRKFRELSPEKRRDIRKSFGRLKKTPPSKGREEKFLKMDQLGEFSEEEKRAMYNFLYRTRED